MPRTILHIDMNAYFAAVEQLANPLLRGRPIAVAGEGYRTVVLTASYEARRFGVRTGMQVPEALTLCPDLVLVPPDNAKYADTCERLLSIYREFTDEVEVFSIDEVFVDASSVLRLWPSAWELARAIKARIAEEIRLPCSVGIAETKTLAKLASDLMKPDGLVEIAPGGAPYVVELLPADAVCGVGPSTAARLARRGIRTLGDLARAGGFPADDSPVVPLDRSGDAKSVGHSTTLDRDIDDVAEMKLHLLHLTEKVARRMRREGYSGRTVHVTVRYFDFETIGHQKTFSLAEDLGAGLCARAFEILDEMTIDRPVRLLGVRVSGLVKDVREETLFDAPRRRVTEAVDRLNDRYGDFTVTPGVLLGRAPRARVLSPSWRPEGPRRF